MKKIAPTILICALLVLACNETLEPTTSKPYIKVGETENMLVNNIDTLFVATRNHGEKTATYWILIMTVFLIFNMELPTGETRMGTIRIVTFIV